MTKTDPASSAPRDAALGRAFLVLLAIAALLLTVLRIHGSSVVVWSAVLHEPGTAGSLLAGTPRGVRSDEWLVWTPSVLAQARHVPPFPVENPALGAGRSPMLLNLPTRHYSTLFRPQLWGYFLFDIEHGFAWNWNVKVFGLLAAMFLLIRKLAQGNFWIALLGTAWVFLSSYTQWWFSCPPMLPEMLASWALALWCTLQLCEGPRWPRALACTLALWVAATNFALSMYPPYQIPLAYLGLAILGGWLWRRQAEKASSVPAIPWLALAGVGVAAVVIPFFVELMPTLHLVQSTSYPGARRASGGGLHFDQLFLGFAEPFISASAFPEQRVDVCTAANFYPLWIAAAGWLFATWKSGDPAGQRQLRPLLGCLLALTLFALCPLPPIIGRLTLLSFATEERLILPIGLGGILLSILVLAQMKVTRGKIETHRLMIFAICVGFAVAVVLTGGAASPKFFTVGRMAGAIALSVVLFALYLWPLQRAFAAVLLAALAGAGATVNPVTYGLAPLTESSAVAVIEKIRRADPGARWLAFDGANQSAFLMAAGVEVLSGAKTLPDLAFYKELDPEGRDLTIYNRYSLGLFQLAPDPATVEFKLFNFCAHWVSIHPAHPALQRRNVRYFVFPKPLENPAGYGLQSLVSVPERGMWIYRRL